MYFFYNGCVTSFLLDYYEKYSERVCLLQNAQQVNLI